MTGHMWESILSFNHKCSGFNQVWFSQTETKLRSCRDFIMGFSSLHLLTWCNRRFEQATYVLRPFKLNSYSNAKHFSLALSHAHFRFWGHERLTDRLISKRSLKSHLAQWVKKKKFNFTFFKSMTQDSIGHLKMLCMSVLSLSSGVWVWMETLQLIAQRWKNASVLVWLQLQTIYTDIVKHHVSRFTGLVFNFVNY